MRSAMAPLVAERMRPKRPEASKSSISKMKGPINEPATPTSNVARSPTLRLPMTSEASHPATRPIRPVTSHRFASGERSSRIDTSAMEAPQLTTVKPTAEASIHASVLPVEVRRLVKIRGTQAVLRAVDAKFSGHQISTIEGNNGAGKSTILGILAGLVKPTRGEVLFGGQAVMARTASHRRAVGLVDHEPLLYPDLSVKENLEIFARLYGMRASETLSFACRRFALEDFATRPVGQCSRGQKQRAALARALMHQPSLLLLDEPDTGLDQNSRQLLARTLHEERARGAAIIVVTHSRSFAAELADRRMMLEDGKLQVFDAMPEGRHSDGGAAK